jgi:NAD dependent epimerase/dehydratase family enzyme
LAEHPVLGWQSVSHWASIVLHTPVTEALIGPVNPVSPDPVRNADFVTTVARVLGHKAGPAIPAFFLRLMFGEMADELVLASRRIEPRKSIATGYDFCFPDLVAALRHELEE